MQTALLCVMETSNLVTKKPMDSRSLFLHEKIEVFRLNLRNS